MNFDTKLGLHTSTGAPFALSAYDHGTNKDVGLYKIELREYKRNGDWEMAIDFGTSHTIASQKTIAGGVTDLIQLKPQIGQQPSGVSLHVSENWPDNWSDEPDMQLELWRPTYEEKRKGLLSFIPSDLWSFVKIDSVNTAKLQNSWEPMTDYSIPPVQLKRPDSFQHTISGFKWRDMVDPKFQTLTPWLQERYLRMAIEMFVADMVDAKAELPQKIDFTFTYPLRGTIDGATAKFEASIREALTVNAKDLGYTFPKANPYKLYSESHAAAAITGKGAYGEVNLVADLGGGTLDLFLSPGALEKMYPSDFKLIADSAMIGGDKLLELLAEPEGNYLPNGWGNNKNIRKNNLRAWMRLEGAKNLFDITAGLNSSALNLAAFDDSTKSGDARILIEKFFRLITDYLARSIVAYVSTHIWPKLKKDSDQKRLKLCVRIQGNGWRLWYASNDYLNIEKKMGEWIKERANLLWKETNINDLSSFSEEPDLWFENASIQSDIHPKAGPIRQVIDKPAMDPGTVLQTCCKFPLCNVELISTNDKGNKAMKWFDQIPSKDAEDKNLEVNTFVPPIVIHSPSSSTKEIKDIPGQFKINAYINKNTIRNTHGFHSPIASCIWENVFESENFRPRKPKMEK